MKSSKLGKHIFVKPCVSCGNHSKWLLISLLKLLKQSGFYTYHILRNERVGIGLTLLATIREVLGSNFTRVSGDPD